MTLRGRGAGATLAVGVLALHLLALQALRTPPAASPGHPQTLHLRVHPVDSAPAASPAAPPVTPAAPSPVPSPALSPAPSSPAHASADTGAAHSATAKIDNAPASPDPGARPAQGTALAQVAPPMRLRYAVTGMTRGRAITGQAELTWQHADRRYEIRLEQDIDHQPRRSQRSAGLITPQGLAPQRFSERARHEEAVHLGQDNGRIVFSANRPEATLLPGAQDRLSLLLQLGARIAASPQAYPAGTWIEMQGVTTREARIWRFRVGNVEELQLPGGHQSTLHLVRAPTGDFEPTLEVWLAPAQDYAPVRIRLTQATGDWQDQQWAGTDRR